ncbi:hypothetical protein PR202_ga20315 [Eleusine coracana subsp. coracana]|uniref:Disease resistance protein At4g27190-like leucine-rich repeats domain-containing protein n=1 Tax=Eleusine coracana subsp. coracana TaxID=191504 RepID=A0AAV5CXJ5_ELECO|nr:hypothetical protein PR202_ga20315 [Eleusine coracana subsp. coracana]
MLILDGCDGIENIGVPNGLPSSLSTAVTEPEAAREEMIETNSRFCHGRLANRYEGTWSSLKWCRVERCPNLDTIFDTGVRCELLETIWVSDLLMARGLGTKRDLIRTFDILCSAFENLQHLHLHSCPRLLFALPVFDLNYFNLQTIHIMHCGDLKHVFVMREDSEPTEGRAFHRCLRFPRLTTIHLHDLPKLQHICEVKTMLASALETIRIRGCFGLRSLPAVAVREPGQRRPTVEIEKDVWDALE